MKKISLTVVILSFSVCCFLLSACVGTSQTSIFYSLKPIDKTSTSISLVKMGSIGVQEVKVPNYLDKPQMVTMSKDELEVKSSEFNRWSEPLTTLLQRTIAEDISVYLPKTTVKPKYFTREHFDYILSLELNKFDVVFDDKVVIDVWWILFNDKGKMVLKDRFTQTLPLSSDNYSDAVVIQSDLVASLAKQIATRIAKYKK